MLPKHEKSNRYYDGILDKLTEEEKGHSVSSHLSTVILSINTSLPFPHLGANKKDTFSKKISFYCPIISKRLPIQSEFFSYARQPLR